MTLNEMETIPEIFRYEKPVCPDDCKYIISPSQIGKFFEYPRIWYEENYLGKKPEFQGSTSTTIGTICHYLYEQTTLGNKITRDEINIQLDSFLNSKPNSDIDIDEVKKVYPEVAMAVMNQYVIPSNNKIGNDVLECEKPVVARIKDNVYLAGTVDRIEGDCIVDFKTVSTKPNEAVIPFNYKIQTLAYTYALRQLGYEINRIRIVYGVKPTKTIGARCIIVSEQIDYATEKLMNDTLTLIADSVLTVEKHPELAYIIFKSMELKQR